MENNTRMLRNKRLHDEVNKDIIYNSQIQNEKSIINSTFEKLKQIDQNFFEKKLEYFDKKHQLEKPYLDKDNSSNYFSEDIKYDLKRELSELKKIDEKTLSNNKNNYNEKNQNQDEEFVQLKSDKFIKYLESLKNNQLLFQKNIEKLKLKQSKKFNVSHDISMTTVHQMRSQDSRSTNQMLVDVQDKVEKYQGKLLQKYVSKVKKGKVKWIWLILFLLFSLMLVSIIVPIFIDF
ncbi:hypothetical protein [Spiroplasma turonicum]|uniref:Transmembrane protein n=1 Tax=Spiroplasma turonicum TaxID=216946 RepID=A0A0K1P754_9MOLU|nr:hypothetical protein [Spiroplasma turonicum]AKU80108.1 hypothetical protein STURON_00862 [Spiroplasma turonicum]ALX71108.1 hypothetical protein STURO_v1c08570 [Spiroplasma turonicum]